MSIIAPITVIIEIPLSLFAEERKLTHKDITEVGVVKVVYMAHAYSKIQDVVGCPTKGCCFH